MNTRLTWFLIGCILLAGVAGSVAAVKDYYIIAATAGPGGSIIPSGEFWVREGGTQIFAITPDDGYRIGMAYVDGNPVGPVQVYTFYSVAADHTISAIFVRLTGSISVESQPPGASVYIDGSYAGKTRVQGPLVIENVPTGMRAIELRLEGYEVWNQQVQVNEGGTTVISLIRLIPVATPTTTVPTTSPTTTVPTTTVPTTSPTTTVPTTTVPTTSPTTTVPTTTVPTTSPTTTVPTTTVPTTSTTTATTLPTTTVPTTSPTTTVPTTSPTTTVPTTTATTKPTTTVSTTVTTVPTTTGTTIPTTTATTQPTTTPTTSPVTTGTTLVTTIPTTSPTTQTVTTWTTRTSPSFTTTATTPMVTSVSTTVPTGGGNITGPVLPPWIRGMSGISALMLMGGLCAGLVMVDLFSQQPPGSSIPLSRRAFLFLAYLAVIGGLIGALLLFSRELQGVQDIPPFISILIPVSGYLLISGLALFAGTLLSHPLKWTLSGHILISLIAAFTAALAVIGSSPDLRIPILICFGAALVGGFGARWEYVSLTSSGGEPPEAPAGPVSDTGPHATFIPSRTTPTTPSSFPTELFEKYAGPELIGVGGIARVFRAENTGTGESVALKIPVQFNETAGKCFMKEIKAWEDLNHENIVNIHEVNILPVPYVEMEYIRRSLADMEKPLPPEEAARIVRGIAKGLAYAHSQGIIHRDIKPQNILITDDMVPKITDWGMSKVMGAYLPHTITGFSLSYAAPEQISPDRFGDTDQRTDIYQLGVVFYELLTGELPFAGEDISQVTGRIIGENPPLPSAKVPGSSPLDEVVGRCLEKNKDQRFQRAEDLIAAIDRFISQQLESGGYEVFEDDLP
ncbi:MAG: protein kinase [Methanomicrobiales archaeon]|nr:protein kinase [Methanomicrobiales archaeon]